MGFHTLAYKLCVAMMLLGLATGFSQTTMALLAIGAAVNAFFEWLN